MKKIYQDIKVLFIENNTQIEEELIPVLFNYFNIIDSAKNTQEGLEKFEKSIYDIVMIEIIMPDLSAFQFIEKIKHKYPKTKFIILTSHTNPNFLIKLIELGVNAYLIKPITLKQIANTLKKVTEEIYTQRNLENKIKEVEQLVKIKSEFLANMSHEIRTPLNAILGFIKLSQDENDIKKIKNYLKIIDSSSNTLLTIINDILDISKIESGKIKIENIDFPSNELFYTLKLFESRAKEKNLIYKIRFSNLPKYLYGDIHRIRQVISNLVSNAIKFTPPKKKVEIYIKYDNDKLYVEVKDEGIGIEKDKLKTIFDSFSQADNSITRQYGGTGLGLTISNKLVELMGGKLMVESEHKKGSKFFFEIPIKKGKKIEKNILKKSPKEKNKNQQKKKILVVEDNIANQMFIKVILNKLNILFDMASNGKEAVEKTKSNRYSLILMDINMPIMSGTEATKEIRKFSKIPIIALSANALDENKDNLLEIGMNDYLTKPIDIIKLQDIINKYI